MKKAIKTKPLHRVFAIGFLCVFILSMFCVDNSWKPSLVSQDESNDTDKEVSIPNSSGILDDAITGKGNNQSVRAFFNTSDTSHGIKEFNISTSSQDNQYLDKGSFNITLGKGYNTTYEIENDSPLELPYKRRPADNILVNVQAEQFSGDNSSIREDNELFIGANSSTGTITFILRADFTGLDFKQPITSFMFRLALQANITVNISLEAHDGTNWVQLNDITMGSTGKQYFTLNEINTNNMYLNSSNWSTFRMVIDNTEAQAVNIKFYYLQINATMGLGYNINQEYKYGLEFDTKGEATIYGFQAWIRTFNASETGTLTYSIYEANATVDIKRSELLTTTDENNVTIRPDTAPLITKTVNDYVGDEPTWFNFDTPIDCAAGSNLFVVLESNTNPNGFGRQYVLMTTLVTAADGGLADSHRDHITLFKNGTKDWQYILMPGFKLFVDASSFSINLQRGYLPSEIGLNIDGKPVQDTYSFDHVADTDPLNYYTQYWWGVGKWTNTFTDKPKVSYSNITVKLNWTLNEFSQPASLVVSSVSYNASVYSLESIEAFYSVKPSDKVYWNLTYNLDLSKYNNWNCVELWFVTPLDWTSEFLIAPDAKKYDYVISTDTTSIQDFRVFKVKNNSVIGLPGNEQGIYYFNVSSPNYIAEVNTYLKYNTNKWKTEGFMPGDNVSMDIGIINYNDKFISDGSAKALLYYHDEVPNEAYYLTSTAADKNDTENRLTYYNFGDALIFSSNDTVPEKDYYIQVNWTNGFQIGYVVEKFYVGKYSANILSVEKEYKEGLNKVNGKVIKPDTSLGYGYEMFTWVINETNDKPEWQYTENETFHAIYNDIHIDLLQINETVLNVGSTVKVRVGATNYKQTLDFDLKFEIAIHQFIDRRWILTKVNSTIKTLEAYGSESGNYRQTWDVELTIPRVGLNAPIRRIPLMISVNPFISEDDYKEANYKIVGTPLYFTDKPKSEFTGVVLTSEYQSERNYTNFLTNIERKYVNTPGETTYAVQIVDRYNVGQISDQMLTVEDKSWGIITEGNMEAEIITLGKNITFVANVLDEKNNSLANLPLKLYSFDGTNWIETNHNGGDSTLMTDSNGQINFTLLLNQTVIDNTIQLSFNYSGDATLYPFSRNITIFLASYKANLTADLEQKTFYKTRLNTLNIDINNVGNTTCKDFKIEIESDFEVEIVGEPTSTLEYFKPMESAVLTLRVNVDSCTGPNGTINITITMFSIESGTTEKIEISQVFIVTDPNLQTYSTIILMSIFGIAVLALWVGMVRYHFKTKREADELISGPKKDAPKDKKKQKITGEYIDVSELSIKKDEEEDDKRVVDFDDMVKEEKKKS